jgi:hypothetical protein
VIGPGRTGLRPRAGASLAAATLLLLSAAGCAMLDASAPSGGPLPTVPDHGSARQGPIVLGIDVNYQDRDLGVRSLPSVLEAVEGLGAKAIRIGVPWSTIQPEPGGTFRWALADAILQSARRAHLTVLWELGEEPAWAATGGISAAPPADCHAGGSCASVRAYVTALVRHLSRWGVHDLIPRNEPQNTAQNWVGGSADDYVTYLAAVHAAAHAVDPTVRVLSGGEEIVPGALQQAVAPYLPDTAYRRAEAAFVKDLYHSPTFCRSVDVLDVHVGDEGPVWAPQVVAGSERAIAACGGRTFPVWVTEVGYSSEPAVQESALARVVLGPGYTGGGTGQATYLTRTIRALINTPEVIGVNWTFLVDPNSRPLPPSGPLTGAALRRARSTGIGVGLYTAGWQPKPAVAAYRQLAQGSASTERSVGSERPNGG